MKFRRASLRRRGELVLDIALSTTLIAILVLIHAGELVLAVVEGTSMEPLLQTGDVVFVVKVNPQDLKPGDVIVYVKRGGVYVIHRVLEVRRNTNPPMIVTKGDNNLFADPPIRADQVVGKVVGLNGYILKLPLVGYTSLAIRSLLP